MNNLVLLAHGDARPTAQGAKVIQVTACRIKSTYLAGYKPEDTPMKPRSTVTALLAVTESLLAARRTARTNQASASQATPRVSTVAKYLVERRPLFLRIKVQAFS